MLSTHVTNLEQSRKLYELGFRKPSIFWINKSGVFESIHLIGQDESYPAYLLSELMEALPRCIDDNWELLYLKIDIKSDKNYMYYQTIGWYEEKIIESDNIVEAACDLLIWCIENWFISTK